MEQFILICPEPFVIPSVHGDFTGYRGILFRFPFSLRIELARTHSLAKKHGRTLDGTGAQTLSSPEISEPQCLVNRNQLRDLE